MFRDARHRLRSELLAFLATGSRSRSVVLTGVHGIGVTHVIDHLHHELLAAGHDVLVVDDAQLLDDDAVLRVAARMSTSPSVRVLVGGTVVGDELHRILGRSGDVRRIELPPLDASDVRALVAQLGIPGWSHRAGCIVASAAGVPGRVLDAAFEPVEDDVSAPDPGLTGEAWVESSARRLNAALRDDAEGLASLRAAWAAEDSASALLGRADVALLEHDLDATIRLAEVVIARFADEPGATLGWAQALRAAALGFGGDAGALLELRTIAGNVERCGLVTCAAAVQLLIAQVSCVQADVATTRRAAIRAIELADAAGATSLAASARVVLAGMLVATGEAGEAAAYAEDLEDLAASRGWHTLTNVALVTRARTELLLGRPDDAAAFADRALEHALQHAASDYAVTECAVLAARAHAATGARSIALAILDCHIEDVPASDHRSDPGYWLALEAIRVLGSAPEAQPAELSSRIAAFGATWHSTGDGGALEASHAEVSAWKAFAAGAHVDAGRRIARARDLWVAAECHDDLQVTECIVEAAAIATIELEATAAAAAADPTEDPAAFDLLTKREREIARYVAGGMTNPEIASELHLSARTVEHHVGSILRKLELTSRRALVLGHL